MLSEREKIELITQISLDINTVKDLDLLLERILTNARRFFNADAGSLYLKEGTTLQQRRFRSLAGSWQWPMSTMPCAPGGRIKSPGMKDGS